MVRVAPGGGLRAVRVPALVGRALAAEVVTSQEGELAGSVDGVVPRLTPPARRCCRDRACVVHSVLTESADAV